MGVNDSSAAVLSFALGLSLVVVLLLSLARLRVGSVRPRYWAGLSRVADSLDAVGFDRRFTTRGHYVTLVALGLLGVGFLVSGLIGFLAPGSAKVLAVGVGGVFAFGLANGVALAVARTGRPRRWVPEPYRD